MQNFDPKLYDSQNEVRKAPGTSTDRGVTRAEKVKESDGERKKFDPETARKSGKKEEDTVTALPSAMGLLAPKKAKVVKEGTKGSEEMGMEDESEDKIQEAKTAIQGVGSNTNNPGALPNLLSPELIATAEGKSAAVLSKSNPVQLEQLMKLLVEKMSILKIDGTTETTLTLQNPPLFAGAKLTLVGYDMAKGQFNITFSELRPDAKQLLDMNRQLLIDHLANKGYVLHIFVATTEREENRLYTAEAEKGQKDKQEEDEQQQKQKQQQQE